jgi:hypothetical protein
MTYFYNNIHYYTDPCEIGLLCSKQSFNGEICNK